MPTPVKVSGTVASVGYAEGPVHQLEAARSRSAASRGADVEAARLGAAVTRAASEVSGLIAVAGVEAAEILEFQAAMLEDEALVAPALVQIAAGADAAGAWSAAMDAQIADCAAAEQEYFRARTADLRDIRDRVLDALNGHANGAVPAGAVLVGADISPTTFLAADWRGGGGIVLRAGSPASHVAMLARAWGVPMLVGAGALDAAEGQRILLDAEHGSAILSPGENETAAFTQSRDAWRSRRATAEFGAGGRAVTADGHPISLMINIAGPNDVDEIDVATCDGVGLMRTEFLFGAGVPDEVTQLAAYARVLRWAGRKPVVIRTLDAGGDKPIPGLTAVETNPFLGLRGIRLTLRRPEVFRPQIRALLRAAAHGNLSVMLPMITLPSELAAATALFGEEAAALGLPIPPIGIMVEVPAVAISPELFAGAAFFSIGSNDLTQYVMAAARDNGEVAALGDPTNPAVLSLIGNVVAAAGRRGIPCSLCGDAGGDPRTIPALLKAGVRGLSVAPAQLTLVKSAIRGARVDG